MLARQRNSVNGYKFLTPAGFMLKEPFEFDSEFLSENWSTHASFSLNKLPILLHDSFLLAMGFLFYGNGQPPFQEIFDILRAKSDGTGRKFYAHF
jgi:hypothetical protein